MQLLRTLQQIQWLPVSHRYNRGLFKFTAMSVRPLSFLDNNSKAKERIFIKTSCWWASLKFVSKFQFRLKLTPINTLHEELHVSLRTSRPDIYRSEKVFEQICRENEMSRIHVKWVPCHHGWTRRRLPDMVGTCEEAKEDNWAGVALQFYASEERPKNLPRRKYSRDLARFSGMRRQKTPLIEQVREMVKPWIFAGDPLFKSFRAKTFVFPSSVKKYTN
jgi:hypothetical protein